MKYRGKRPAALLYFGYALLFFLLGYAADGYGGWMMHFARMMFVFGIAYAALSAGFLVAMVISKSR